MRWLLAIFLLGCIEEGLSVDVSCTYEETKIVQTAISKANQAAGYQAIRYLGKDEKNDDEDFVECRRNGPPGIGGEHIVTRFGTHKVVIYVAETTKETLSITMHEIGHYLGAEHVKDRDSVMSKKVQAPPNTEYTDIDRGEMF